MTWSKAGKPSTWQFQEDHGEYTLFVDLAWGKNALFDGTKLIEVWAFTDVIKPFVDEGFIIIQDNESGFNSRFFVPADDL